MSGKNKATPAPEELSVSFNPLRFSWHVGRMVAGSARPGRYNDIRKDFATLKGQGIEIIVNLCESALDIPPEFVKDFTEVHEPVLDGHPPEPEQLENIIALVKKSAAAGKSAVVHCRGGVGRTATVLIPLIMAMEGVSLQDAVTRLRQAGRYTQTMQQWHFLEDWAGEHEAEKADKDSTGKKSK
ncbi:MAG TPA: dual specificity protein phosphatase family protein [bacterium]|nr:dual specificity protein phosphatase family protein [bacterium]